MTSTSVPTHAGAVVFRPGNDGPEILLISSTGTANEWVLPKGHIEAAETPEAAARRELVEEAGIRARILAPIGTVRFEARDETVVAEYFLARLLEECRPVEERDREWLSLGAALERLTFEESREILRRARASLDWYRDS